MDAVALLALPQLLLSTTDLVQLYLWNILTSAYISPERMIIYLYAMTKLFSSDSVPIDLALIKQFQIRLP